MLFVYPPSTLILSGYISIATIPHGPHSKEEGFCYLPCSIPSYLFLAGARNDGCPSRVVLGLEPPDRARTQRLDRPQANLLVAGFPVAGLGERHGQVSRVLMGVVLVLLCARLLLVAAPHADAGGMGVPAAVADDDARAIPRGAVLAAPRNHLEVHLDAGAAVRQLDRRVLDGAPDLEVSAGKLIEENLPRHVSRNWC